jgi:nucleoside 2-deoxyribosyltransferase
MSWVGPDRNEGKVIVLLNPAGEAAGATPVRDKLSVMFTIYFAGSISGGRGDVALYREIVAALEREGHRVLAGAVAAEDVTSSGEALDACAIFDRDLGWIADADILVAEVSMPSTGVGYEIATARYRYDIPVICLYRPAHTARCTAMVAGDRGVELIEYVEVSDLIPRLSDVLAKYTAAAPPCWQPR